MVCQGKFLEQIFYNDAHYGPGVPGSNIPRKQ